MRNERLEEGIKAKRNEAKTETENILFFRGLFLHTVFDPWTGVLSAFKCWKTIDMKFNLFIK